MPANKLRAFLRPGISEKAERQGTGTANDKSRAFPAPRQKRILRRVRTRLPEALTTHVFICSVPTPKYQRATPQGPLSEVALQRCVPDTRCAPPFPSQACTLYLELHSLPGEPRNATASR